MNQVVQTLRGDGFEKRLCEAFGGVYRVLRIFKLPFRIALGGISPDSCIGTRIVPISRFSLSLLILLLAGVGYLSFEIVQPFLSSLVCAVLLAVIFYPVYLIFHKHFRSVYLASPITVAIVLVMILGPLAYLLYLLLVEISSVSAYLQSTNFEPQKLLEYPMVRSVMDMLFPFFGLTERAFNEAIRSNLSLLGKEILGQIPQRGESLFHPIFDFIITAIVLFSLFAHGSEMVDKLLAYLPFSKKDRENLKHQIKEIVTLTIYGGLTRGLAHGILGAVAFGVIRFPSPLLLGLAVALTSFIPLLGFNLYLWSRHSLPRHPRRIGEDVLLGAMGGIGSILIDNIPRPLLIARKKCLLFLSFSVCSEGLTFWG